MNTLRNAIAVLATSLAPLFGCGSETAATQDASAPDAQATSDGGTTDAVADADLSPLKAEIKTDLNYRTVAGKTLAADLYLPDRTNPAPVVVIIHGGGFSSGDKAGKSEEIYSTFFQGTGIAAFSINYRVYDDYPPNGFGAYPNSLYDVKCSIMWIRKHADEYRVDKNHVFVLGGSAGGYFTNMVGTSGNDPAFDPPDCTEGAGESSAVQGVVTYFGPGVDWTAMFTDPARVGTQNGEKKFLSLTTACTNASDISGICKTASAGTHIDSKDPPFFVSHSDDDPVVPVSQGRLMKTLLEAKNVSVTYREVHGKAHGWHARFDDAEIVAVRDEVTAWIKALAAK
jgi:alpha-L-fucosidase 2